MNDPQFQLPDEYIEAAKQLLDLSHYSQWLLGELIIAGIEELSPYWKAHNGRTKLIRQLASKTGVDESTLRDRHNVVAFWKPKMKTEYEVFTWSQLRAIKSAGEQWEKYAIWALDNLPAPPSIIRAQIAHDHNGQPPWFYWWKKLGEAAEKLVNIEAPDNVKKLANYARVRWRVIGGDEFDKANQSMIK